MSEPVSPGNFLKTIIESDKAEGRLQGPVVTRFPPEPNGYLHIGHAKSICLNFGLARDFDGRCHLRFDDTNPLTENPEYVESMMTDIHWLGFDWGTHRYHASDNFEKLIEFAQRLIRKGVAYVCDLSLEDVREMRGTLTEPGRESPFRNRTVDENLKLFEGMCAGEFEEGSRTLRAKIDMAAPNLIMRDPVLYRIRKAAHYHRGSSFNVYPSYDWAHGQCDYIEGVTHSICTLEFEDHRPLYDWCLEQLEADPRPHQYEFARLKLEYTVVSKRFLLALVREGDVSGWDDPRMPTLTGFRRRGVRPEAIRAFCDLIGVARGDSLIEYEVLQNCIRQDLEADTPRVMCVHQPLKVVLTNWPEDEVTEIDAPYLPDESTGTRRLPFARELYIEREDFMEDPPKGFFRLAPGKEVRLRRAYVIRCDEVVKDAAGEVTELRCSVDLETLGANPVGRKVKGIIHWVSAQHAHPATVRLYERLFTEPVPAPDETGSYRHALNPESLEVLEHALVEPAVAKAQPGQRFQFERKGYYIVDEKDSTDGQPVFNRIVPLRDSWAKAKG